ncbi:MAG: MFS transporter [Bacteroidota bacterium]|nr:MFS transporter [Bacteroidota bacterium]MDP4191266.1 MFS transporter [Bacteroidota bacterium]MDP4194137.1 MFS transporter [Bacteroidota bacterium]
MYKKNLVFTAACLGMLLFGVVMISVGSILPSLTEKFAMDKLTAGSLVSLLPIGILVGSVVFGPIIDRYGYKMLLIVCSLLVFLGLEGIAYAEAFSMLQISIFLIGFGGGVLNGETNALVADISSEGKGANLSLLGVFFGIGALGMPAILALLSKTYSYTLIISAVGFFVLLPVLYFCFIKFPVPKQPQGVPLKKSIALLKDATLILMGLILFLESGVEGIVNNWSTTHLQQEVKLSPENALIALSYLMLGLTVARLVLGFLLKRLPSYRVLFMCIGVAVAGSLCLMFASSLFSAIIGLVLLGIGFAATFPVVLGYVGDIYANLSGTAFSIVIVIGLIGNTILNYLVGAVSQSFGIKQFPIILLISLILMSFILSIVLRRISAKIKI